jgi:hypothetical protein
MEIGITRRTDEREVEDEEGQRGRDEVAQHGPAVVLLVADQVAVAALSAREVKKEEKAKVKNHHATTTKQSLDLLPEVVREATAPQRDQTAQQQQSVVVWPGAGFIVVLVVVHPYVDDGRDAPQLVHLAAVPRHHRGDERVDAEADAHDEGVGRGEDAGLCWVHREEEVHNGLFEQAGSHGYGWSNPSISKSIRKYVNTKQLICRAVCKEA